LEFFDGYSRLFDDNSSEVGGDGALWTSLQASEDFTLPEWHRQLLEERQKRSTVEKRLFSTVAEVRDRLQNRTQ
jgi:hypothetical protein